LSGRDDLPKQIGRRQARVEDRVLLEGEARFLDDLPADGVLHLAFARAAHAHAVVRGVNLTDARGAPGVRLAFGPQELI